MTITAELADGRTLEFPDGTDPSVVQNAVKKLLAPVYDLDVPKPMGEQVERPEVAKKQPIGVDRIPLVRNLYGAGETMLSAATAIPATVGGTAKGIWQNPSDPQAAARTATEFSQNNTYTPRTDTGKAMAQGLGDFVNDSGLVAIAPLAEVSALSRLGNVPRVKNTQPRTSPAISKRLMQSAVKPTLKDIQTGKAATAVQTLLDEGINPTKGGVDKLQLKISGLQDSINSALKNSPKTVDKQAVASRITDLVKNIELDNPTPQTARAAANQVYTEFVNNKLIPDNIPVEAAQRFKIGIYKELRNKYGLPSNPGDAASKALARGLKEEIVNAVPEIAGLNAQESKLITTLKVAERRALMDANKNPMGLALLAHNPASWAAFMADKSALFKSLAARMINNLPQVGSPAPMLGGAVNTAKNSGLLQMGLLGQQP
jgi:PIN domain nuclease of toxin-antitoxin system